MIDEKTWFEELMLLDTKSPEPIYRDLPLLNRKERRKLNSNKTIKKTMRKQND